MAQASTPWPAAEIRIDQLRLRFGHRRFEPAIDAAPSTSLRRAGNMRGPSGHEPLKQGRSRPRTRGDEPRRRQTASTQTKAASGVPDCEASQAKIHDDLLPRFVVECSIVFGRISRALSSWPLRSSISSEREQQRRIISCALLIEICTRAVLEISGREGGFREDTASRRGRRD